MVSVLRARCARTAADTPTPPTASPVSPTSTRNAPMRSTKLSMPGAPRRLSRQRAPLSGKAARQSARSASRSVPGGSASR